MEEERREAAIRAEVEELRAKLARAEAELRRINDIRWNHHMNERFKALSQKLGNKLDGG